MSRIRHQLLPQDAVDGRHVLNKLGRRHDTTRESPQPPPKGEGTVRRSGSSTVITRPADRTFKQKMTCTNEATRLVYEPGVAGHKSEMMMSPASCSHGGAFHLQGRHAPSNFREATPRIPRYLPRRNPTALQTRHRPHHAVVTAPPRAVHEVGPTHCILDTTSPSPATAGTRGHTQRDRHDRRSLDYERNADALVEVGVSFPSLNSLNMRRVTRFRATFRD